MVTILLLATGGLVAGCGDDTSPVAPATQPTTDSAKDWPAFDPPTKFAVAKGVELPAGVYGENVLLNGTMAFVGVDQGLLPFDLTTGKAGAVVKAERTTRLIEDVQGGRRRVPVLTVLDGRNVVVVPVLISIPAQGTRRAGSGVDLVVADAATGKQVSVVKVDLADGDISNSTELGSRVTVLAVRGGTLVLSVGEGLCVVVDLAAGRELWRRKDFVPGALAGDAVIGVTPAKSYDKRTAVGLALQDGKERWKVLPGTQALEVHNAGPNFAVVTRSETKGFFAVIRPDGSMALRAEGNYIGLWCRYDQVSVTICGFNRGLTPIFALESSTNAMLWKLPDEATRREAPTVTVVWHGMVYGRANGQPVVLDAKTGADREPSPGLAPLAVSANGGVGVSQRSTGGQLVKVHPATG